MHQSTGASAFYPGYRVVPRRNELLCPVCRRLANCLLPAAHFQWQPCTGGGAGAGQPQQPQQWQQLQQGPGALSGLMAALAARAAADGPVQPTVHGGKARGDAMAARVREVQVGETGEVGKGAWLSTQA